MGAVRIFLIHGRGIKVPDGRARHDVEAKGPKYGEIQSCIDLFHETGLLGTRADVEVDGEWSNEALHEEFASEGENNDIEGDKSEVARPFAILGWGVDPIPGVGRYERVVRGKRV